MKTLLLVSLLSMSLNAAEFRYQDVKTSGTGCPTGSTDVVLTPDKKAVSILFSEMNVQVPQYDGDNDNDSYSSDNSSPASRFESSLAHKVCDIKVEADLEEGERVDSVEVSIDFRGFAALDAGTQALFHSQFLQWSGPFSQTRRASDMIARKVWRQGPSDEDWFTTTSRIIPIQSECARVGDRKVGFSLQNTVKAQVLPGYAAQGSSAFVALDSADLSAAKLSLRIQTSRCYVSTPAPTRPVSAPGRVVPTPRCARGQYYSPALGSCISSRTRL
jgi:hypothetical protein